ncbi:sigma-70 family RNA polymerase sigma factor [uncultured Roseovarius sp.]|uniref:RNA polymerase sigma factor n=1 Tax=uncultured Roseovarius sp. TaxID=293344 RepID=UPI002632E81F|nr:sigma-70 family RNA polymerase sigma factor [uncultured Roseovarius sp.]
MTGHGQSCYGLSRTWYRRQRTEYQNLTTYKLIAQDAPDAERVVIARQQVALVINALAMMPERMRKAFRLSRLDGLTYREIGARLGVSEASAYRLVGEALVQIVLHLDR